MKVTYRLDFGFFKNLFHFIMFCAKLEIYGHFKFFNEENSSENTEPLKQYRFEYFLYFSSANETCIAGRYSVKITKKIMNTDEEILWEMGIM